NQTEDSPIKKNDQERELDFQNTNFIYKGLTGQIDDPVFSPMLVVLLPGDHDELLSTSSHDGEEFAYVLSGELTVKIGDRISELREGDSFHIKSSTQHTWYNRTDEIVKLIYVYSNIDF